MEVCSEKSLKGLKNAVGSERCHPVSPLVLPTIMTTLNNKIISVGGIRKWVENIERRTQKRQYSYPSLFHFVLQSQRLFSHL